TNRTAQASRGHTETMPEQRELKAHARKDNGFLLTHAPSCTGLSVPNLDGCLASRQAIGLDTLDPLVQLLSLAVVHQLGEGTYVCGGAADVRESGRGSS
ncbi:hypothetical protein ACFWMJ_41220, partial [Streptomyces hawaiiensis]|uniref:hypothetical protein n=1 Tax=Streptomyces hawaiiensis TaxID=67305 RepID=UPI003646D584